MEKSQKQRTLGAVIAYFGVGISIITGFLSVSLLTRFLGQSEYGVYSLVSSLVGYISIMDFGMHSVTVRYIAVYRSNNEQEKQAQFVGMTMKIYLVIDILVAIVGACLLKAIPYIFAAKLSGSEITLAQQLFSVLLLNLLVSMPGAVFAANVTAYECFIFDKSLQLLKLISKLLLLVAILLCGGRALALVWLDTLLNIGVLLAEAIYSFVVLKLKIDFRRHEGNNVLFRQVVKFTSFVFLASISDQVNWKLDSLILGVMQGSLAVAVSAVGMQLVSVYRSMTSVISGVYLPRVTQMVAQKRSKEDLTDVMIHVGQIQLLMVGLILCGFVTVGMPFITIWAGVEYYQAFWVFLILALALIIPSTQSIGISILEAMNMHGFRAKVYAGISIANLIVTITLVGRFGVVGAALGTALALVVGNIFIINWYYWKIIGLNIPRFFKEVFGQELGGILASTIFSFLVESFLFSSINNLWLQTGCGALFAMLAYALIMTKWGMPSALKTNIRAMIKARKR